MAAFYNTNCGTHPGTDFFLNCFIFPISYYDFTFHTKTAENMTILTVTVCRLVLIHEIHVDRIIWNLTVELCVQVKQRFSVLLQTKDPWFCRWECMHPRDDTGTVFIVICLVKCLTDQCVCDQSRFPDNFIWKISGCIQCIYDDFCMLGHMSETFISV